MGALSLRLDAVESREDRGTFVGGLVIRHRAALMAQVSVGAKFREQDQGGP
jgi:hypothetical protein